MDDELSLETEQAMRMALSVLRGDARKKPHADHSRSAAVKSDEKTIVQPSSQIIDPEVEIVRIGDRRAISITEKYALVMEGLSTYRFEHPLGMTFVVDNSRNNLDRDLHHREALSDAMNLARAWGLDRVYVLN